MGNFANFWRNETMDHLFGKGAYTPPTIFVGLSSTLPADDGTNVTEPSGEDGYARVETAALDWSASGAGELADGIIQNVEPIEFPEATGDWGALPYFVFYDAATDGNMLVWGTLTQSKVVGAGDTARFPAAGITVTLD